MRNLKIRIEGKIGSGKGIFETIVRNAFKENKDFDIQITKSVMSDSETVLELNWKHK